MPRNISVACEDVKHMNLMPAYGELEIYWNSLKPHHIYTGVDNQKLPTFFENLVLTLQQLTRL